MNVNTDIERRKLKIKANSLSAEQKMIRLEEKKHKWKMRALRGKQQILKAAGKTIVEHPLETNTSSLYLHRLGLRKELRSTHIARCFLRGRKYSEIENFSYQQPDWNRIQVLIERYSGEEKGEVIQRYAEWMHEALRGVQAYLTDGHFGSDKRNPNSVGAAADREWVNAQFAA